MEINELNKKQLVLLTLLITFVVSIATGIVTVSLMQQMPKSVPQTINNVIQKTIERVTTVEVPATSVDSNNNNKVEGGALVFDSNAVVNIYSVGESLPLQIATPLVLESEVKDNPIKTETEKIENKENVGKLLGEGIIISDVGLILVESNILNGYENYKVVLDKKDFPVSILKKFGNGFTVLKIVSKQDIKNKEESLVVPTL